MDHMKFYIDGAWVDPAVKKSTPVVNPATEEAMYEVALGSKADVDKAVAAARRAFETWSQTSREERVALLTNIMAVYKTRMKDLGAAVPMKWGRPPLCREVSGGSRPRPFRVHARCPEVLLIRGEARISDDRARACWRGRHDYTLELAAQPDRLQGRARPCGRLHDHFEALRVYPEFGAYSRRDPA